MKNNCALVGYNIKFKKKQVSTVLLFVLYLTTISVIHTTNTIVKKSVRFHYVNLGLISNLMH